MKLSFSTLACPDWDLRTICANAHNFGYDGIDFRGYLDTLDVTRHPLFTEAALETRRMLGDHDLRISGLSSSIQICDPAKHGANLEEARRSIAFCQHFGVDTVRVFGGGDSANQPRERLVELAAETMGEILALDGADDIHWGFETHDVWVAARDSRMLLDAIPHPAFQMLWDMGNSFMLSDDGVDEILDQFGERLTYTHIKDAVHEADSECCHYAGWRYTAPGTGELPLAEAVRAMSARGYDGWLVFEHEKRWHPDLDGPSTALPAFVNWARGLIERG